MVDSFFTNPNKRKRSTKARSGKSGAAPAKTRKATPAAARDDDITSESELENETPGADEELEEEDSESEYEGETEADKRRRLAKQYLSNLKAEVDNEEGTIEAEGFDAADLDREILSRRLREDVAEDQGKVYRFIAEKAAAYIDMEREAKNNKLWSLSQLRNGYAITDVAAHYPYAYTVTKDIYLTKWDISVSPPKPVKFVKGDHRVSDDDMPTYIGHRSEILCVAVSPDGRFVVTGGRDRRLVVWSTSTLAGIKVLETRDRKGVVNALAFRRGTNELYAACADLKVRTYNIDHQSAVETLYGHQDSVADVSALAQERCVTVGSRDRTAMLWKISEESRLTFRGGESERNRKAFAGNTSAVFEGSIDVCAMIDDAHFVTGSDNGKLALWSTQKKKPVYIVDQAHGVDEPMAAAAASAETDASRVEIPPPQPRYITALTAVPYSDLFMTGSWNGEIKMWQLASDFRSFKCVQTITGIKGFINRIAITEQATGPNGKQSTESKSKQAKLSIVAAVSKELKFGRWKTNKKGKNGIVLLNVNVVQSKL